MSANQYYPQQYIKSRPFFLGAMQNLSTGVSTLTNTERYNQMCRHMLPDLGAALFSETDKNDPNLPYIFTQEKLIMVAMAEFKLMGSRVLDVEPALVTAFLHSDVGDICLADLKLPFEVFYLHFGPQKELAFNNGKVVLQGVFVRNIEDRALRLTLVGAGDLVGGRASLGDAEVTWDLPTASMTGRHHEIYDLVIHQHQFGLPVGEAIQSAIETDFKDLESSAHGVLDTTPGWLLAVAQSKARHESNRVALKAVSNLLVNTLCYITAYAEDSEPTWQNGAPDRLVKLAESTKPTEARRATSKLAALGFMPVTRAGGAFASISEAVDRSGPSPHWRRAHWRRQHYGEGLKLVKPIWIRPIRVLGGGGDSERVYTVSGVPATKEIKVDI